MHRQVCSAWSTQIAKHDCDEKQGGGGKVKVTLLSGGGWGGGNFIVRTIAAIGVQNKY